MLTKQEMATVGVFETELRTKKSVKLTFIDDLDVKSVNNRNGMKRKCARKKMKRQIYRSSTKPNFDFPEIDIEELPDIEPDWSETIKDDFQAEEKETETFISLAEKFAPWNTPVEWEVIFPDLPLKRKRWLRSAAWNWTPEYKRMEVEDNTELMTSRKQEKEGCRPGIKLKRTVETDRAKFKKCKVNLTNLVYFLTEAELTRQQVKLVHYK